MYNAKNNATCRVQCTNETKTMCFVFSFLLQIEFSAHFIISELAGLLTCSILLPSSRSNEQ